MQGAGKNKTRRGVLARLTSCRNGEKGTVQEEGGRGASTIGRKRERSQVKGEEDNCRTAARQPINRRTKNEKREKKHRNGGKPRLTEKKKKRPTVKDARKATI